MPEPWHKPLILRRPSGPAMTFASTLARHVNSAEINAGKIQHLSSLQLPLLLRGAVLHLPLLEEGAGSPRRITRQTEAIIIVSSSAWL